MLKIQDCQQTSSHQWSLLVAVSLYSLPTTFSCADPFQAARLAKTPTILPTKKKRTIEETLDEDDLLRSEATPSVKPEAKHRRISKNSPNTSPGNSSVSSPGGTIDTPATSVSYASEKEAEPEYLLEDEVSNYDEDSEYEEPSDFEETSAKTKKTKAKGKAIAIASVSVSDDSDDDADADVASIADTYEDDEEDDDVVEIQASAPPRPPRAPRRRGHRDRHDWQLLKVCSLCLPKDNID